MPSSTPGAAGAVAAPGSPPTTASSAAGRGIERLGKQEFLQLLVAQLRSQDPLKPMEDKEFITQLAQFTTLETMQSLDKRLEALTQAQLLAQAATLLGRDIEATTSDGTTLSGTVSEVRMANGTPQLVVGEHTVPLSQVTRVRGTS